MGNKQTEIQSHLNQWTHNREFLPLIPLAYPDWIVTVTFYAAHQAVDALFVFDGVTDITSHRSRNAILMKTNRYKGIYSKFLPLYDMSRVVRYLARPAQWIPAAQIPAEVLGRYLYPIEKSVHKLMGSNAPFSKIALQSAPPRQPPTP